MNAVRVLLVDGDPDVLATLGQVLLTAGHDVLLAGTNRQARSILSTAEVDVLVCDCMARGADAEDLVRITRWQGVPILLVSGKPRHIVHLDGGTIPFLAKPFGAAHLVQSVALLPQPAPSILN